MSNGAQEACGSATYRMLRELGSRAHHAYAAIRDPRELVVAQRFVRVRNGAESAHSSDAGTVKATPLDGEAMALLLRDARCLAKNWQLNVSRVRHVDLAPNGELTIATELIDGTTLEDLIAAAAPERTSARDPLLALPIFIRILLDVLAGLHALHGLRDGRNVPLDAIHGELCPANVVIGKDGVARIVNVLRKRPVTLEHGSEAVGYAAPEALDGSGAADPRADVYAVGVMLWEALAGQRLYDEAEPARVLSRQREGDLAAPAIHPSSPFARLADTAVRALAFDPSLRFRSAAEMAAELRKIAGARLASGGAIATRVGDLAGDRIRMRRATLDPGTSGTRKRASERAIVAAANGRLRASPRRVAPTLRADVPLALIAASRQSVSELDDLIHDDEGEDGHDDLPGPRGSSPELDLETAIQRERETADAAPPCPPAVSPVTPDLPFPCASGGDPTAQLISTALATTTAQMRAVAVERAAENDPLTETSTPNDFVIPIDVMETLNEGPPARHRGRGLLAGVALFAAIVLVAMATFVAFRTGAAFRGAPATAAPTAPSPPAPPLEDSLAMDPSAIATTPTARPKAATIASAAPSTTASAALPSVVRSLAPPTPAPPPAASPPPAPPKKSIYDPDGL